MRQCPGQPERGATAASSGAPTDARPLASGPTGLLERGCDSRGALAWPRFRGRLPHHPRRASVWRRRARCIIREIEPVARPTSSRHTAPRMTTCCGRCADGGRRTGRPGGGEPRREGVRRDATAPRTRARRHVPTAGQVTRETPSLGLPRVWSWRRIVTHQDTGHACWRSHDVERVSAENDNGHEVFVNGDASSDGEGSRELAGRQTRCGSMRRR